MTLRVSHIALLIMLTMMSAQSCKVSESTDLFTCLEPADTGVHFENTIYENYSLNVLDFTNMYTGSGVAIADFDNDGYEDLFFGGNMSTSRLYLNRGDLTFEDITEVAGVTTDRWVTGVSVVDINRDGRKDLYLSVSGFKNFDRSNYLFMNQTGEDGELVFVEQAADYGLGIDQQVTQSVFFDYDRDGDDDIYMIVNPTDYDLTNVNTIRTPKTNGESLSNDLLYRNNGDGTYSDITKAAGILYEGYSLGVGLADINNDGWQDIYVANDFLTNDTSTSTNKTALSKMR